MARAVAGRPMITTTASSAPGFIVHDGQNAIVTETGDLDGLVAAIEQLLDDGVRSAMSRRSLEMGSGLFTAADETAGYVMALKYALAKVQRPSMLDEAKETWLGRY